MPGVAVLTSGGMDSCAMLADIAQRGPAYPIYVKTGMIWERAELTALRAFINAINGTNLHPLTILEAPSHPLLGPKHWTMSQESIPEYDAPDETVYIPGRNIILISLAAIWCSTNNINRIAIGTLAGNPFPDATPKFRKQIAKSNSTGLNYDISVTAPMSHLHKEDLLAKFGNRFPLHLTLTCSNPHMSSDDDVIHCGSCNKCRERHEAYLDAGIEDFTQYRTQVP